MIITITGKPCSGKGSICDVFCKQHNFELLSMGKVFRRVALEKGIDKVSEFQNPELTKEVDKAVDDEIIKIGQTRLNENIIIDSRTAWHFIPQSFKVYVDVDWIESGKRLIKANREGEQVANLEDAVNQLKLRHAGENARYKKIYNINCTDMNNFDLLLDSTNKTVEDLANTIYTEYIKFVAKNKPN